MRKAMMMLAAAFVISATGSVMAVDICPQYEYGQWNGIHYFFCTLNGMCNDNATGQTGQSVNPAVSFGCDPEKLTNCKNPITSFIVKLKGDEKNKQAQEVHITKTNGIKKKMKARKGGGGPGESEDPAFKFNLKGAKAKFVVEAGGKKSDRPVFVKAKDKNGHPQAFYFRVLELKLEYPTNPAMKISAFIGQQLDEIPTTTEELVYVASDGPFDHIVTNRAGEQFHVISFDEIKAP